jgi:putative transcriptional regulator
MDAPNASLTAGTLLVSAPVLEDPNFRRTVVLLCDHEPEQGSFGLVLTQQTDIHLEDVLEGVFVYNPPLYIGGPVQRDTLHFIHRKPDVIEGGVSLPGDLVWGGTFESVEACAQHGNASADDLRFFVGYSGWSPGQLQAEMDEDAWIVSSVAPDVLFNTPTERLWRTVLRRMGGEFAWLSNFPDDPRMN